MYLSLRTGKVGGEGCVPITDGTSGGGRGLCTCLLRTGQVEGEGCVPVYYGHDRWRERAMYLSITDGTGGGRGLCTCLLRTGQVGERAVYPQIARPKRWDLQRQERRQMPAEQEALSWWRPR